MNKRIKELMLEAGYAAPDIAPRAQKLVELIVKECVSCSTFIGITTHNSGLGPQPIRYTSIVNDKIREHFGKK